MSKKKPSYNAVVATEGKDGKTYFNTIGAAWPNKKGFTVKLHALPQNGEILLFPPKSEESSSK